MKPTSFDIQAIRAAWESISAMLQKEIAEDNSNPVNRLPNPAHSSANHNRAVAYPSDKIAAGQ